MLIRTPSTPGIRAAGYEEGHFWVKLESGRLIEFLSPVPDTEQSALLHSSDPIAYLNRLRGKYRSVDRGCLLGL